MGKATKFRNFHKSNKRSSKDPKNQKKVLEDIEYLTFLENVKSSNKYNESIDYLDLFYESKENNVEGWKFKSNLQTFIKKYILIKDIFGSKAFTNFQLYFTNMSGKKDFITVCEEIIRRINEGDKKVVYEVISTKINALDEEDYDKLSEKIKKRCVILVENN